MLIAGIFVLYVFARLWHLTDSCLWFDEIFSVHAAAHSWNNLFWFVAQDLIHPPLFYVLLKIWIAAGGESLFWLRLFPVFFSILSVAPFMLLCRELKLPFFTTSFALFFLAANGALIKYAQEVRMYSLLQFFSLASAYVFAGFWQRGKNIQALCLINILLVYTHYFGWFVVVAQLTAILIWQRSKLKIFLATCAVCLLSYAPWIYMIFQAARINADVGQNIGWMSRPDFLALIQFAFDLIEPFYYQASNVDWASDYRVTIALLIIIGAAKILFLIKFKNHGEAEKQNFRLLAILIVVPLIIALTISLLAPFSIWGTRHLIIVFAPAALLIGVFLEKIENRTLRVLFAATTIFLFGVAFVIEARRPKANYIWCAWENLSSNVSNEQQTTKIYVFEDLVAYHFWFAERSSQSNKIVKITNLPGVAEDRAYFLPRGFDAVQIVDFETISDNKFYIAFRDADWNIHRPPLKNLVEKGYKFGEPKVYQAQGLKAFLVEVNR